MHKIMWAGILMGLLLVAPMASALDVTIAPENPAPHEEITATFPAPTGAVNATVMVCIGDKCFVPAELELQGNVFTHTFYINETGEAHLNISVEYQDGSIEWDNSTTFDVEATGDSNGGTPGFTLAAVVAAVIAIAVLQRRTKS